MKELSILKDFQNLLNEEEYDSTLLEASDELPHERLVIFLGLDGKDREKILEMTAFKQEMFEELAESKSHESPIYRIQFQMAFPFDLQPQAAGQLAGFLCYLNRLVDMPGFEMDEVHDKLFYRYILMYGEEKINKKLFVSIVGMIMLMTELFATSLEQVASGERTFNELLEEIIKISGQLQQ